MRTRVLVIDDHALFRDGVVSLLKAAGMSVVGEAGDGKAAVQEALRLKPDLILLDIHMPEGGGLVALKKIRKQLPDTKVVMLTVSEDSDDLIEAISSGAHGYLLKSLNAKGLHHILIFSKKPWREILWEEITSKVKQTNG